MPARVDDIQLLGGMQVNAVRFAGKAQIALLGAFLPVFQGFDVAQPGDAFDAGIAYVTDGKIGMQRLADADGIAAQVEAGQVDLQLLAK
ncbi:hypothetical protein D3C85_837420 [compost metagenome]